MDLKHYIPKSRLEAFSDAVIAIIITITILEVETPHDNSLASVKAKLPEFCSYVLSFLYLGSYWNNHHHLLHTAKRVNIKIMWANLHFLFWLTLIPFVTGWLGENYNVPWPTALYGCVLFMITLAYSVLQFCIIKSHDKHETLAIIFGKSWKIKISLLTYAIAISLAFIIPWLAYGLYFLVALIWVVPNSRIEQLDKDE